MAVSRRQFLKLTGSAAVAGTIGEMSPSKATANERENRLKGAAITTSICPYCAVGCGIRVFTKDKKVISIEGDPDHPINQGNLCSKGASLLQMANNPERVTKPRYRASGASEWKEVEWDWAVKKIAQKIKKSRDASFVRTNADGREVNRCDGIASVGSAALDNEECYIYQKWLRSLGLVSIEHQARI